MGGCWVWLKLLSREEKSRLFIVASVVVAGAGGSGTEGDTAVLNGWYIFDIIGATIAPMGDEMNCRGISSMCEGTPSVSPRHSVRNA